MCIVWRVVCDVPHYESMGDPKYTLFCKAKELMVNAYHRLDNLIKSSFRPVHSRAVGKCK